MTYFQLVFRRDGQRDDVEHRYNDDDGQPRIDGRLIVDGETYLIHGVEWLLRSDNFDGSAPRFLCTLVAKPASEPAHPGGDLIAAIQPPLTNSEDGDGARR